MRLRACCFAAHPSISQHYTTAAPEQDQAHNESTSARVFAGGLADVRAISRCHAAPYRWDLNASACLSRWSHRLCAGAFQHRVAVTLGAFGAAVSVSSARCRRHTNTLPPRRSSTRSFVSYILHIEADVALPIARYTNCQYPSLRAFRRWTRRCRVWCLLWLGRPLAVSGHSSAHARH